MFHVDKDCIATGALCFGDQCKAKGGFARRFRSVNLADSSFRKAAYAQSKVDGRTTGRNHSDIRLAGVAQLHDRSRTKLFVDRGEGEIECLFVRIGGGFRSDGTGHENRGSVVSPQRQGCHAGGAHLEKPPNPRKGKVLLCSRFLIFQPPLLHTRPPNMVMPPLHHAIADSSFRNVLRFARSAFHQGK